MNFNPEDKIVIKGSDEEREFYKLIQFKSSETDKRYLIYTDGKYTDGKLNIYSSILEDKDGSVNFIPVTAEEDLEIVKRVIVGQKIKMSE